MRTIERHLFAIERKKILAKKLAHVLEQITETTDNREVSAYHMPGLTDIDDEQDEYNQQKRTNDEYEDRRKSL